jgi:hypothetical protein
MAAWFESELMKRERVRQMSNPHLQARGEPTLPQPKSDDGLRANKEQPTEMLFSQSEQILNQSAN